MGQFHDLIDLITSAGAIIIPVALWYVKSEISQVGLKLEGKHALLDQKLDNHIQHDEEMSEQVLDNIKSIKTKINLL